MVLSSDRIKVSETEILAPQDEIISVGPMGEVEPVPITGTLAYINNGNAWVMRGSSTAKRLLTTTSDLDSSRSTFSLSPNGRQLLFAAKPPSSQGENSFNQLWLISDVTQNTEPVACSRSDVLYADSVPGRENSISYSTGEAYRRRPVGEPLTIYG